MGLEIYIKFSDLNWLENNKHSVEETLKSYPTYIAKEQNEWWINLEPKQNDQIWLRGAEPSDNQYFDVRFLFWDDASILFEIRSYPESVKNSARRFIAWLESQTDISVAD